MQTEGIFFDGEVAADRGVIVELGFGGLSFSGEDVPRQDWRFGDLVAVDRPRGGQALRLTHAGRPGARLILDDAGFVTALIANAPRLRGQFNPRVTGKALSWAVVGLVSLAVAAYLVVQLAPQKLAFVLPDSWREKNGTQIEASLTQGGRLCETTDGRAAIAAMMARLAEGNAGLPPVAVNVYAIPVMNAFAMPGGRIVVTSELIARAGTPEEVVGVVAHELGHVANRHPETQIIRVTGLQLLVGIATGGGGDTISTFAELAAILSYSRAAEGEADAFALKTMEAAAIDPMGLQRFFELVLKEEGRSPGGAFGKITSAFSTHPGTGERIKTIHPLPPDVAARPVLNKTQWQALRNICR